MIALRRQSIRSSIRTVTLLAALTSLLLTMLTPFVGTAWGVNDSPFEIDGDAVHQTAIDWDNVEDLVLQPDVNNDWGTTTPEVQDLTYGPGTSGGGTKEQTASTWNFTYGNSTTPKDDLSKVFAAAGVQDVAPGEPVVEHFFLYMGFERWEESGGGSSHVNFEFNQSSTMIEYPVTNADETFSLPARTNGDILVIYTYDPNATPKVVLDVFRWQGGTQDGTWLEFDPPTAVGAANSTLITRPDSLKVSNALFSDDGDITAENFGEAAIDLTQTFANTGGELGCLVFASVYAKSRASGSSIDSNLFDVTEPANADINTCADVTLEKKDVEGNSLDGATLELYEWVGAGDPPTGATFDAAAFDPTSSDWDLAGSCVTGADSCTFTQLEPGTYVGYEAAAPDGYDLSDPRAQLVELTNFDSQTVTFTNPRLPYSIDVTPETDTNPVGVDHDFLVTATEDGSPVAAGTELDIDWAWDVAPDPDAPGITAVNGVDIANTNSTTCTTQDDVAWDGGTVNGACIITVTSSGSAASGTLTATFDLPYQNGSGTDGPTADGPTIADGSVNLDTIFDEGDKVWRGYRVDIDEPATNLAGDEHLFTVTVTEFGPGGDSLAGDVVVGATWSGPAGSTIVGDGTTAPAGTDAACTTATSGEDEGTCVFTVDSDAFGTGDLTITVLEGQIGSHAVTQTTFTDEDDVDTAKTWVAYRLWVTPDEDINQVDWNHPFVVHVQSNDGSGWSNVEGATFTAPSTLTASDGDWSFDSDLGGDLSLVDDTCDTGTGSDGTCTITVVSPSTGTVQLTVSGVTVPWDGGTEDLDLSDTALSAGDGGDEDNVGEKTWVDYGVTIGTDGTNLLGDEHPFTVSVTRSDIGALSGATVDLTWDGPSGSTIYPVDQPGSPYADSDAGTDGVQFQCTTDAAGECDFEVNSTTTEGEGTLSVTQVTDNSGSVTDGGSITFALGEKDTTKEWVSFDVDLDGPAVNLTGDDHDFTVTATRTDDGGTNDAAGTVTLEWDGPIGSSVSNGTDTETVGAGGDPVQITCTLVSGECTITVDSDDPGAGDLTALSITSGGFTVDLTAADSGQSASLSVPVETTKTWIGVDLDISPDSTNRVGVNHTFDVTATLFDGDPVGGEDLPVTGATLCVSVDSTVGSIVGGTAGDGDPCAVGEVEITSGTDGEFEITVASSDGGTADVTLESVHFTYGGDAFSVDLVTGSDGYLPQEGSDLDATKTWVDYELAISPQDATNLLPTDPDHPMVVTLSSQGGAPIEGQTIELTLTSDNGATIVGGSAAVEDPEGTWTSTDTCTTNASGQCDVTITASSAGTATLSASYDFTTDDGDHTITSAEFDGEDESDTNGQDADKRWTTYSVTVEADAVNLLGTPHTFTVTVMQDGDDPVSGATFTQGEPEGEADDASYITISDPKDAASITGGTCFTTGTDGDGQCTVEVDSDETTLATVTANYLGEAADSESSFFADGSSKRWIDYRLDVDPDTADNLVDTDHVFTVTVEMDLGDETGWQDVPDGSEVTLTLAGLGAITDVGAGGTIDEGGLTGTCLTTDGTCSVTITSPDAGQSSLTAEFVGTAAGEVEDEEDTESVTFTDEPAVKNWVDYELVMSQDAVNPIGTDHTFTATLTVDTGEGFGPAGGEDVDFSLEGPGTVVEVENGTVDEDARGGTCTTDVDGTCNIVITSDVQGDTTVSASYFAEVGETTGTFEDAAVKTWESNPAIDLVKDVDVTELPIGGIATYTYTITNTGDVTLTNIQLIDKVEVNGVFRDLIQLLGFDTTITLDPGESIDLTSFHIVTEDDLPGPIDNVATVTGEAPDGEEVSDIDDETVDPFGDPAIELDKVVAIDGADPEAATIGVDPDQPGDTVIPYEFTVTNTGNVTLTDVTLMDIVLTEIPAGGAPSFFEAQQVEGVVIAIDLEDTTLAPAESTTGTLAYQVRAADVENSVVVNVAEVTGVDPEGTIVRDEDPASVSLVFPDEEPQVLPQVEEKPAPAPVLPRTGFETLRLALWAALVAGMGVLLLLSTRGAQHARRRRD